MKKNLFLLGAGVIVSLSIAGFAYAAVVIQDAEAFSGSAIVALTASTSVYIESDAISGHTCYVAITKNSVGEQSSISCVPGEATTTLAQQAQANLQASCALKGGALDNVGHCVTE